MNFFVQGMIIITSCISIWLIQHNGKWTKWGFVVGLIGQPFWVLSVLDAKQYGMLFITFWFIYCHLQGIIKNFGFFHHTK